MREATQEDAEAIEELEIELFPDNCFGVPLIKSELFYGNGWVIDGDEEGEIAAYLLARYEDGLLDITRVGTSPKYRRRGHATKLLEHVLQAAPDTMLTVRKDNAEALRLYHRFGFDVVGDTGFGSWVMQRVTSGGKSPSLRTART